MSYYLGVEPSSVSNQESGHDGVRVVTVDNGPPRMRKDKAQSDPVVNLIWNVVDDQDFIRLIFAYKSYRHEEWEITMMSSISGYDTYLCRVVPGTFVWKPNGDLGRSISCSVEIIGVVV